MLFLQLSREPDSDMLHSSALIFNPASATLARSPGLKRPRNVSVTQQARREAIIPTFQLRSTDDSSWPNATAQALYGQGPWTSQVVTPKSTPNDVSLSGSTWIWSQETFSSSAPAGDRAFRRTFTPPAGKTPSSSDILITADNKFILYVNGATIGTSPATTTADDAEGIWSNAQYFSNISLSGTSVLFAVLGTNLAWYDGTDTAAGLIATIKIVYKDGSSDIVRTDSLWKVNKEIPSDFQFPASSTSSASPSSSSGASSESTHSKYVPLLYVYKAQLIAIFTDQKQGRLSAVP